MAVWTEQGPIDKSSDEATHERSSEKAGDFPPPMARKLGKGKDKGGNGKGEGEGPNKDPSMRIVKRLMGGLQRRLRRPPKARNGEW